MFRTALVVTEDLVELARLTDWLERGGFIPVACAGPRLRDRCPRTEGAPCLLRDAVDVAVVGTLSLQRTDPHSKPISIDCTKMPDDGTTVFVGQGGVHVIIGDRQERLGGLHEDALMDAVDYVRSRKNHPSRVQPKRSTPVPSGSIGGGRPSPADEVL